MSVAPETVRTSTRVPTPLATPRGRVYATLQGLRGYPVLPSVRRLLEWERLPVAEFERLQAQRLRAILAHAREHVPLYRTGRWKDALGTGEDGLAAWPVLEREALRERYADLVAQPRPGKLITHETSGTTGNPTQIAFTPESDAWGWAHRYRGLLWHGVPIGVRALRLSNKRRPLRDALLDQRSVPALDTTTAIEEAIAYLRDERPPLVSGPPSALFYLARHMRERGMARPLASFARVGGEQLFPFQRTEIERVVARRVINSYGCTEIGALAGECPAGSMHVYADHVHLEIFRDDAPVPVGEFGDIVATALHNPAMPLVRYRVGDCGRLSTKKCPCGRPHPVLLELQSRGSDVLDAKDGTTRHGAQLAESLGRVFADAGGERVRQAQFVQLDRRRWQVLVEPAGSSPAAAADDPDFAAIANHIAELLRDVLGSDAVVETRFVAAIPRENGKFRYYRLASRNG